MSGVKNLAQFDLGRVWLLGSGGSFTARTDLTVGEASMRRRLLTGGTVWAGTACVPRAAWMLVDGDRIAAIADEHEPSAAPPPAADERLDLAGGHVLPGFADVHLHLSQAAWFPLGVDGLGWDSLADCLHAVRVEAGADVAAPWLLFWRVARWRWPQGRLPSAVELDQAAPGRRVLVSTLDMHRGAVSSAGLAAAGLADSRGAARFGGEITRDRRGRPTGELWEAAYALALQRALTDLVAHAGEAGTQAMLQAEAARLLAYGITHAHDPYVAPGWQQQMLTLHAGSPVRLSWATGDPGGMHARPPGPGSAPDGPYGDSGREVKLFADGGDRCALRLPTRALAGLLAGAVGESWHLRATGPLREALRRKLTLRDRHLATPYLRYTDTELANLISDYAQAGVRVRIHALGNLAGGQAARVLTRLAVPPDAATIDHLLLLDPATAEQVAATGVPVSYQPGFLPRYGDMLKTARADRYLTIAGGRLLLDAGVPLALSSDHPCGAVDPLHNLRAAVQRRLPGRAGMFRQLQPDQALTPTEAVRAATVTAAATLHAPGAGGLAPGQIADFVICDGDPFQPGTRVAQTWIGGTPVWRQDNGAPP
jgi:predicted amidohydrolase YtcJ